VKARPEESREMGFLVRGFTPLHELRGQGSAVNSPTGSKTRLGRPAEIEFSAF